MLFSGQELEISAVSLLRVKISMQADGLGVNLFEERVVRLQLFTAATVY